MDFDVEISEDNRKQWLQALHEVSDIVLEEWGLIGEKYAKIKCPVDTGNLRNSITHARDAENAYIGTNVEYAPYVELGTSRMRAQPYLKPAVADHVNEYRKILESYLTR